MNGTYWNASGGTGRDEKDNRVKSCSGSFFVGKRRFKITSLEVLQDLLNKDKMVDDHTMQNLEWVRQIELSNWNYCCGELFDLPVEEFYLGNLSVDLITEKQKEIKTIIGGGMPIEYLGRITGIDNFNEKEYYKIVNYANDPKIRDKIRKWVRGKSKCKTLDELIGVINVLYLELLTKGEKQ